LVGEAIRAAGSLGTPLEYFHRGFRPTLAARWGAPTLPEYVAAVHRARTDASGTLSTKLFWPDVLELTHEMDPEVFPAVREQTAEETPAAFYVELQARLERILPRPTFIYLVRQDRVRQAVSSLVAAQTGRFRELPGASPPKAEASYDRDRIAALIGWSSWCREHWERFFAATGRVPYRLSYEQLERDYAGSVRRLLEHLGVQEPAVPLPRLRRQGNATSEAFVLRYLRERGEVVDRIPARVTTR
jgi:LPS sulfotransferase NodH